MMWGKFYLSRVAGLVLVTATSLEAGNFAVPAEGPVAFRRDKLPLDAETMTVISRQLVTLAAALDAETAANRRTAAQMLALSTALDPGNAKARELLANFKDDNHQPATDSEALEKSRTRIWQNLAWLDTPEAGEHGRALAACLTDVLVVSDPQNPRAQAMPAAGERGAWKGWIPGVAAYEAKAPVVTEEPPPTEIAATDGGIRLTTARVFAPLWKQPAKTVPAQWSLVPGPVEMAARMVPADDGESQPFRLVFGSHSSDDDGALSSLVGPLLKLLKMQHGNLPAGGRVTISSSAIDESLLSSKRQSISAAAAVLASSAISGREPDATIIGLVDATGAFKLPTGFWDQLQSLGPGNGGRLVLPAAAADYLPSMLALERPRIFFDYEVVLAADFKELLDLSAKTPEGTFAKVSAQFREIREKAGTQPLGQYVANPFIRRRLGEIVVEVPAHYSAKMLAIQGAGSRPVFASRAVLAAELRRAIEPMDWLAKREAYSTFEDLEIARFSTTYQICHDQIAQLYRYADKNDRGLVERVQDMATTIRAIDRAAKSRGESYEVSSAIEQAHRAFLRDYTEVAGNPNRENGGEDAVLGR